MHRKEVSSTNHQSSSRIAWQERADSLFVIIEKPIKGSGCNRSSHIVVGAHGVVRRLAVAAESHGG